MFLVISTVVVLMIAFGLYYRHRAKAHIPLMLGAFVIDVSLVLAIEINRHAIKTVVDKTLSTPDPFVMFHAAVSLFVIVLYILQIYTGTKIYKGKRELIPLHQKLALIFIVLRLTNYITSFQMAERL